MTFAKHMTTDISGVVTAVRSVTAPVIFTVKTAESIYTVSWHVDCPVAVEDYVIARISSTTAQGSNIHSIVQAPYVELSNERKHVVSVMTRLCRGSSDACGALYDRLMCEHSSTCDYIGKLAYSWFVRSDKNILSLLSELSNAKATSLLEGWRYSRSRRSVRVLGLTDTEIDYMRMSGEELRRMCVTHPYRVLSIPLEKADELYCQNGMMPAEVDREVGRIMRIVWRNLIQNHWVGTPSRNLIKLVPNIATYMPTIRSDYQVITELSTLYLPFPHLVETSVADLLTELALVPPSNHTTVNTNSLILSQDQHDAITGAMTHSVSIITGGPGTGKSTVIGQIVAQLLGQGVRPCLCSRTGKAVARLRQVTHSRSPATMDLLIKRAINPSSVQCVIIDEASMVTTELFYEFITMYNRINKIILVGDVNQLAPIGWGSLLSECVKSLTLPTYYLTTNHRVYQLQDEQDGIILNANAMLDATPPFAFVPTTNFSVLGGSLETVATLVRSCHASGIKATSISIITPYISALDGLNRLVQSIYYPNAPQLIGTRCAWVVGDRVMIRKNTYSLDLFNGEEGTVKQLNPDSLVVTFGETDHLFYIASRDKKKESEDLLHHCYAITVDKSQGSEWDFVIVYIPQDSKASSFLNRHRLYTAVTRAKRACWIVSNTNTLSEAVLRQPGYRHDNLAIRLRSSLPLIKPVYEDILPVEEEFDTDPYE